jgi:hypothetical protein
MQNFERVDNSRPNISDSSNKRLKAQSEQPVNQFPGNGTLVNIKQQYSRIG